MKSYYDLTPEQQEKAVLTAIAHLLEGICNGTIRFDDKTNQDDLQAKIDRAFEQADEAQTPWFAGEFVMDAVGDEVKSMARASAEDAFYVEPNEHVFHLTSDGEVL